MSTRDDGGSRQKPTVRQAERFWSKVQKTDGCWNWVAYTRPNGYGQVRFASRVQKAHRVAWLLAYGYLPDSRLDVCHRCDNRRCVRPDHLFVGTRADNMRDASQKGRTRPPRPGCALRGEMAPGAKLKLADVELIRAMLADGAMQLEVARRFSVHPSTISLISSGLTWRAA